MNQHVLAFATAFLFIAFSWLHGPPVFFEPKALRLELFGLLVKNTNRILNVIVLGFNEFFRKRKFPKHLQLNSNLIRYPNVGANG